LNLVLEDKAFASSMMHHSVEEAVVGIVCMPHFF